jgi:hypothetical protein
MFNLNKIYKSLVIALSLSAAQYSYADVTIYKNAVTKDSLSTSSPAERHSAPNLACNLQYEKMTDSAELPESMPESFKSNYFCFSLYDDYDQRKKYALSGDKTSSDIKGIMK